MGTRFLRKCFLIEMVNEYTMIELEITLISLAWWIENSTSRDMWEKESNLCPLL